MTYTTTESCFANALPKEPTFARWLELSGSRHSLLRALQYEAIAGLKLVGRVLDVGGDGRSGYQCELKIVGRLDMVNIDAIAKPTCITDLEGSLPFLNESFDHVISLNTFEHLLHDERAISEVFRILTPGGSFHFLVPFCYRVHGSPRDFHRHTAAWWNHVVREHGASHVEVEPLVWDRMSSGIAVANGNRWLRACVMLAAVVDLREWARRIPAVGWVLRTVGRRRDDTSPEDRRRAKLQSAASFALGYYIAGTKERCR